MAKNLAGKTSWVDARSLSAADRARLGELVPPADLEVLGLLVMVTRLARRNDQVLAALAEPHGLLPSETSVLLALWWVGPPHRARPTELAEQLLQTSGGMTATLRRLEHAGFVVRVDDPDDRRVLLAELTPSGIAAALAAVADQVGHWKQVLDRLPPTRRRRAIEAVSDLLAALEATDAG